MPTARGGTRCRTFHSRIFSGGVYLGGGQLAVLYGIIFCPMYYVCCVVCECLVWIGFFRSFVYILASMLYTCFSTHTHTSLCTVRCQLEVFRRLLLLLWLYWIPGVMMTWWIPLWNVRTLSITGKQSHLSLQTSSMIVFFGWMVCSFCSNKFSEA